MQFSCAHDVSSSIILFSGIFGAVGFTGDSSSVPHSRFFVGQILIKKSLSMTSSLSRLMVIKSSFSSLISVFISVSVPVVVRELPVWLHLFDIDLIIVEVVCMMELRQVTTTSSFAGFDVSSCGPTCSLRHSFPMVWMSSLIFELTSS